jgi:nitrogen fixation NifU-like protein
MSLNDLYREVILDHSENPRNKKKLEVHQIHEHGSNPLCGDKVDLYLNTGSDHRITEISYEGNGCSISQASISMLTEVVQGKTLDEAQEIIALFKGMMLEDKENPFIDDDDLEDLASLEGVKKYPVRVKCALLGWNTLAEALKKA